MKLTFDWLQLEGFKSFASKPAILDLVNLGTGLHYLNGVNKLADLGSNGAGKSTLIDALMWCLQGRTAGGLRNPDVRPWYGDVKTTRVECGFSVDDRQHVVIRTIAPNTLTLDGKQCDQREIDRVLGLPFDLLTHTVIMGQGRPLFFDLAPRQKMELFGTALDLDRWDRRALQAADSAAAIVQEFDNLELSKSEVDAKIAQIEQLIEDTRARIAAWSAEHKQEARELQTQHAAAVAAMEKAEGERGRWDLAYDGAAMELRPIEKQLRVADQNYQHALAKVFQLRDAMASPDKCPMCGQAIKGHAAHKQRLQKQYAAADAEKNKLLQTCQRLEKSHKEFSQRSDHARDQLDYYTKQVSEAQAKVNVLQQQLDQHTVNPFREQLHDYENSCAKLIAERTELRKHMKTAQRKIERRLYWSKAFKDIRLEIVQTILQELELVTAALLEQIGLLGWRVAYAIEKETQSGTVQRGLAVTILSPENAKAVRWENWSGGEQQRLRIVSALALSQVLLNHAGVEPDLEVLDEPGRSVSPQGLLSIIDMLADRAQQMNKIILYADQNVVESARFSSTITVVKNSKGSVLKSRSS